MALNKSWASALAIAAVATVGVGAVVMSKPAAASPTVTVYKTPT